MMSDNHQWIAFDELNSDESSRHTQGIRDYNS